MTDDAIARVNLSSQADRPTEDDDALYYSLLEMVDEEENATDTRAWIKGAAMTAIEAAYGEARRQLFATEARIARSTAYEYAQMFRFWLPLLSDFQESAARSFELCQNGYAVRSFAIRFALDARKRYPSLRRTHYRYGMRIGRKLGVDAALAYVDDCQGRALSIEAAGIEAARIAGKPVPPKPIAEFEAKIKLDFVDLGDDTPILHMNGLALDYEAVREIRISQRYRVVVYALESATA